VGEAVQLGKNFPGYIDDLNERSRAFRSLSDRYGLTEQIIKLASTLPGKIGSGVLGFLGAFFGSLFTALLVIVLSIYFMADLPRLRRGRGPAVPGAQAATLCGAWSTSVVDKVGAYMIGNLLISLGRRRHHVHRADRADVPFALPLALAVAIFDLFPMIGATLGAVVTGAGHLDHHGSVADHGHCDHLFRGLPAVGELPHRAEDPAQHRSTCPRSRCCWPASSAARCWASSGR
jgi:predicted PurR-regulated permease PerM